MSGFYFSSVPKLKIRRGGVVDDILPPPPVSFAAFVSGIAVRQAPETMVSSSSFIPLASEVTSGVPSVLFPGDLFFHRKSLDDHARGRQSPIARRRGPCPGKGWRIRRILVGPGKAERILLQRLRIAFSKIEERPEPLFLILLDELDPTVLEKLPASTAIAAVSVHKYWTSTFWKAADNVELTELLKLAEMYTSQSHVFNCELYKVLAMKVDELRSTVGRGRGCRRAAFRKKDL
ncbi:hypothetical protein Fot_11473 [Forsythia ovata]|uniref:Uncharacterized protein n=1 Tax=Forsythia ovata TaxID=205694 RepID=A0ABD1WJS8_9LAMI